MPFAKPGLWFRALSHLLIVAMIVEIGVESQLAYAEMAATLASARRPGLPALNSALGKLGGNLLPAQKAINAAPLNLGLRQAMADFPSAPQMRQIRGGVPHAALTSMLQRPSGRNLSIARRALHSRSLHAFQSAAGPGGGTLQPIDATAAPAADPNDPYVVAQAQALNNDPNLIFAFVRDQIGTDVYQGSLRGARGTLWTKAGNSLDKASLLIALLGAAGIQANYVHGSLTMAQTQQMIATMFKTPSRVAGCPPPGSVLADPVNDPQLQADASDHFWVEFGPDATPADPSFANAQLGQTFSPVIERFTSIPGNLRHKIVFRLDTELQDSLFQTITTTEVLSYSFDAAYLVGRPVTLGHFVNAPTDPSLLFSVTTFQYSPYLRVPQDNPDPTLDKVLRGQDYQEIFSNFAGAQQALTGVFLNMDVINSQGQAQTYTSTLLDRIGFAARQGQAATAPISNQGLAFTPLDLVTVAAMGSSQNSDALGAYTTLTASFQNRQNLLQPGVAAVNVSNPTPQDQQILTQATDLNVDFLATAARFSSLSFVSDSDAIAQAQSQTFDVKAYWDTPRLILFKSRITTNPANPLQPSLKLSMDLRKDQIRVVAPPQQTSQAPLSFNLMRGILENQLEQAEVKELAGKLGGPGTSIVQSTVDIGQAVQSQNLELLPITATNLTVLDTLNLSIDGKARMVAAVSSGKVILTPSAALVVNGVTITAWYEYDPSTGYLIDVFDNGEHDTEYGLISGVLENTVNFGFGVVIGAQAFFLEFLSFAITAEVFNRPQLPSPPTIEILAGEAEITVLALFARLGTELPLSFHAGLITGVTAAAIYLDTHEDPPVPPIVIAMDVPPGSGPGIEPSVSLSIAQESLLTVPMAGAQLPLVYAAQIQNTGPSDDTFSLSFPPPPPGYLIEQSLPSVLIPAGQTGQIGFCVVPTGQIGAPGSAIPLSATVTSTTNPAVSANATLSITNPSVQAAALTATPSQVTGTPGSSATAMLTVQSVGNSPVTANLVATTSPGLTLSGLTTPVTIAPGSSLTQQLTLSVSSSAVPNQPLFAAISATYGDPAAPTTVDNPASILFLVVDPNALSAVNGSAAAAQAGRTDIANFLGQLGSAITNLAANPGSTTIQAQVLTLIDALSAALNSPCLAAALPPLAASRAQIASATDPGTMTAALNSLSSALANLDAVLTSPCIFPFDFALFPNAANSQPNFPATFKLAIQNKTPATVTYDLSLSGLPSTVSGGLNTTTVTLGPGQFVPTGNAGDPAVTLLQTSDLSSFQFTVTASVDGIANSAKTAVGTMVARSQFVAVQQVTASPGFINPGDTASVSASIVNAVNDTLPVNVNLSVLDANGNVILTAPSQSTTLTTQFLLTNVNFGPIATQSLANGNYTLQVTVTDSGTGQLLPGGTGSGVLVVGSPVTATLTVAPQFVPPGNSTVMTTLKVNGSGASITNPLILLGTAPTASPAESIALSGTLAYLCDENEVTIMDVTDPAHAVVLGTALASEIKNSGIIYCSIQRKALTAFSSPVNSGIGSNFAFSAFDLTNAQQPALIATTPTKQGFFQQPTYIGNIAFVPDVFIQLFVGVIFVNQSGDVVSYDLSDFAHPKVLGSLRGSQATTSILGSTELNSTTLYIGGGTGTGGNNGIGRIQVVDVTNPSVMSVVGETHVPGTALLDAPLLQGNLAISIGVNGGWTSPDLNSQDPGSPIFGNIVIATFDISNPRTPALLSTTTTPYHGGLSSDDAQIGPNLFLFGGIEDTRNNPLLLLVDTTNPSAPTFKTFPVSTAVNRMVAQGTILFTADGAAGFAAYRIPGANGGQFTASIEVPKGTGVTYDPASFSVPPAITSGAGFDTLTWTNPPQTTITWNSQLTGMEPGQSVTAALGGTVNFTSPAGPGSVSLPPVSVTVDQILDLAPGTASMQAGTPASYSVIVSNPTNTDVTYNLLMTGIAAAWTTVPATVTVPAGGQSTVPLTIQTEPTATPETYTFVVSALTASGIQANVEGSFVLSGPGAPAAGGVGSTAANGVLATFTPATATAGQGTSTTFNVQITNTGNVADNYVLSATVPPGVVVSFSRSSLSLQPGTSNAQQAQLQLTVTPGTPPSISNFTVIATSQTNPAVTSQQTGTLTISGTGVSVALNPTNTTPGGSLQATVTNLGSATDTFNLTLSGPGALVTIPSQSSVTLPPGASQAVPLVVGPAPFATLGTLPLIVIATSQAAPAVSSSVNGGISIPATLGVSSSFSPSNQLLPAPGTATYLLQVQNTGTIEDGYSATITGTTGPLTAVLTGLDGQPTQSIAQFRLPALSSGEIVLTATDNAFGIGTTTVTIASLTNPAITTTAIATLRTPTPPVANAGQNQSITVGLSSRLDGSASADTNTPALPLTYRWTLLSAPPGSAVSNSSIRLAADVRASFTPDVIGSYVFQLAVTNVAGTATATVSLQAQDAAPLARAGRAQNVRTGSIVMLDGRGSFDPDGSLITYQWQFASVPSGSALSNKELYGSLTPLPFFRPDVDGVYHLRLTVSDSLLASAPDFVDITAYSGNIAPDANAGPDQYAAPQSMVTLDGGGSVDPDNSPQPLAYTWSFQNIPGTSTVTNSSLINATSAQAQFVPDVPGDYALTLSVSDGQLTSTSSVIVHVVLVNLPPLASAGANQRIFPGSAALLNGSGSSDPDSGPGSLGFLWHLSSAAPNSTLLQNSLGNATNPNATLSPDQPGNYVVRLAVNDGLDESYGNTAIAVAGLCDADHDGYITRNDIDLIQAALGLQVQQFDSRDFDQDGVITAADIAGCSAELPTTSLSVSPRALSFYADRSLTLLVTSASGSLGYSVTTNQPWITVTPNQSTTAANPVLVVTVNPAGFTFGTYEGAITIIPSSGGAVTVPVMMNIPMLAPATAGGDACLYALNESAANAFQLIGALSVNVACGIVSDSGSSSALSFTGSGNLTATDINLVGNAVISPQSSVSPAPVSLAAFQPDPLSFLAPLNSDVCDQTNFSVKGSASATLNPGTYCNGITIGGSASVTFNPGTYILLGGGLNLTGSSIVSGSGVTFFLTQGLGYSYEPLSVSGSAQMNLSAPADGPMEGILFFQDPRIGFGQPDSSIQGSVTSIIQGVMYFPTTGLEYSGAAAGWQGKFLIVVADTIRLNGSVTINSDFSDLAHGSPLKRSAP